MWVHAGQSMTFEPVSWSTAEWDPPLRHQQRGSHLKKLNRTFHLEEKNWTCVILIKNVFLLGKKLSTLLKFNSLSNMNVLQFTEASKRANLSWWEYTWSDHVSTVMHSRKRWEMNIEDWLKLRDVLPLIKLSCGGQAGAPNPASHPAPSAASSSPGCAVTRLRVSIFSISFHKLMPVMVICALLQAGELFMS